MVFWKTTPVRKIHLDEIPQIVYDMQLEKVRNFEMDELKLQGSMNYIGSQKLRD